MHLSDKKIEFPAKVSFKNEREIKTFSYRGMLRDFVTSNKPNLEELFKEVHQTDMITEENLELWNKGKTTEILNI